ncbi:MAG TPA: hypothetical protein VFC23_12800 [Thermoanaerobaculia bacterium]|nr:hypothetical protein [Thermoanaerobaculia bacterium]
MKFIVSLVLAYALTLFSGKSLEAQAPSILEPKAVRHQGPPLWNSADSVADSEKIINLDLIGSDTLRLRVEKQRRALGDRFPVEKLSPGGKPEIARIPPSECKSESYVEDERGGGGPSTTLSNQAQRSRSIVRGTIRTVELGFSFGTPSSLLGVEALEVLKGPSPKSPFYIDYPVARFRIGPLYFCNATKGYEPKPGDEVLLFDVTGPVDRIDVLYAPRTDQIFFQSQSGALFLPPHLKNTPDLKTARRLTDVVDQLRSEGLLNPPGGAR